MAGAVAAIQFLAKPLKVSVECRRVQVEQMYAMVLSLWGRSGGELYQQGLYRSLSCLVYKLNLPSYGPYV